MSSDRKRKPDFGKRGCRSIEPAERRAGVVQRLKEMGGRWLRGSILEKKNFRTKGFKRARP
jgi:hypothetical protein